VPQRDRALAIFALAVDALLDLRAGKVDAVSFDRARSNVFSAARPYATVVLKA